MNNQYLKSKASLNLHKQAKQYEDELEQLLAAMTPAQRKAYARDAKEGLGKYRTPAKRNAWMLGIPGAIAGGVAGFALPEILAEDTESTPGWLPRVLGAGVGMAGGGLVGAGIGAGNGALSNWMLGFEKSRAERNLELAKAILNNKLDKKASADTELQRALDAMTPAQLASYEEKKHTTAGDYGRAIGRSALTLSALGALLGGTIGGIQGYDNTGHLDHAAVGAGGGALLGLLGGGLAGVGAGALGRFLYTPKATKEAYNTELAKRIAAKSNKVKPFKVVRDAETKKYRSELETLLDSMTPAELDRYNDKAKTNFTHHLGNIGKQTAFHAADGALRGLILGGPLGGLAGAGGGALQGAIGGPTASYLLGTEQTPREYNLELARKILNA